MKFYELAINLCGYYDPTLFSKLYTQIANKYNRIYIGSEYCSAFLALFDANFDKILAIIENEKKVSIVFPMMQEMHWHELKKICAKLTSKSNIDEVIVNDIGTLVYCRKLFTNKNIVLGKLFCKTPREPRIDLWRFEGINNTNVLSESVFETPFFKIIMQEYMINQVETEFISKEYTNDICINSSQYYIGIHYPYIYITSGTICPLSCYPKNGDIQFTNKKVCDARCMHTIIHMNNPELKRFVINRGNVYMYKAEIDENDFELLSSSNIRLIYNDIMPIIQDDRL